MIQAIIIALFSCAYIIFAIIGSGPDAIFYGVIFLFILTPFYAFMHE